MLPYDLPTLVKLQRAAAARLLSLRKQPPTTNNVRLFADAEALHKKLGLEILTRKATLTYGTNNYPSGGE